MRVFHFGHWDEPGDDVGGGGRRRTQTWETGSGNFFMKFDEFAILARIHRLGAILVGVGQWRITGVVNVDYYPRLRCSHVRGTSSSWLHAGDHLSAFKLARVGPPTMPRKRRVRRNNINRYARKTALWSLTDKCHWCGEQLLYEDVTLDHLIPITRGGTNAPINLVIACAQCNGLFKGKVGPPRSRLKQVERPFGESLNISLSAARA